MTVRLAVFAAAPMLQAATPEPLGTDTGKRTISGRLVPYGQVGRTNMGVFTFAPGSITVPEDPSEIKLLVEHDQRESVGYATALEARDDGIWATFHVPPGDPAGDLALRRAANRVRNAFSVGVDLDAATLEKARRSRDGKPIAASGGLRETSLVAVPAFAGSRVTDVAASADPTIVLATWSHPSLERFDTMHTCPSCGAQLHPGIGHQCDPAAVQAHAAGIATSLPVTPAAPAPAGGAPTQEALQAAILGLLGVPAAQAQASAPEVPAVVPAVAGAAAPQAQASAQVGEERPTYTFDGRGDSFIRDAWASRMEGNVEASARIARFSQELATAGPVLSAMVRASLTGDDALMTAAVETRVTAPEVVEAQTWRGDMLVRAVDVGRPMFARMRNVRLTDATPFKVPTEGEFTGVGPHTEGTAHVAEGTLVLGNAVVSPTAVSGAYRFSRELADSSNPAIDGIALRAMIREYRRDSEAMIATALALMVAGGARASVASVNTVAELRANIIAHALANNDIPADFAFMGAGAFTTFANEVATDGRPMLPPLNPTNAAGTSNIRQLALSVDGMPAAASSGITSAETFLVNGEDVLVGESNLLTFRFDQPEGPGIIKIALWAYQVAQVLRDTGVKRLTTV